MDRRITILGAGSTGMTTAAWLESGGWEVTLWDTPEQSEDFEVIRRQGGIMLRGGSGKTGCVMPHQLTNDFQQALSWSERVLICTSAQRHEEIAREIAPAARYGQAFLFSPGNFGSFLLEKELKKAGKEGVLIGELSGNLWACRRTAPGEVLSATPLKNGIKAAALPSADTPRLLEAFEGVLPLEAAANILEASLNSPNVVSHVGGSVLNAQGIEQKGPQFAFFQDGLGETVLHCLHILEQERNAVLEAMGLAAYNPFSEGHMRMVMDRSSHREMDFFRSLDGPSSFAHRYVSEDAACGVAMLVSLGRCCGVPVPLTEAFLTVAGAINGADYMAQGRTLENLGLSGLTPEEISQRI